MNNFKKNLLAMFDLYKFHLYKNRPIIIIFAIIIFSGSFFTSNLINIIQKDITSFESLNFINQIQKEREEKSNVNETEDDFDTAEYLKTKNKITSHTIYIDAPSVYKDKLIEKMEEKGYRIVDKGSNIDGIEFIEDEDNPYWQIVLSKESREKALKQEDSTSFLYQHTLLSLISINIDEEKIILQKSNHKNIQINTPDNYLSFAIKEIFEPLKKVATLILIVGVLFLLYISHATIYPIELDLERSRGALEPFSLSKMPIWVLYVSKILMLSTSFFCLSAVYFFGFYINGLDIPLTFTLSLLIFIPCLSFFASIWGVFTVFLFHHKRGRMFARIFLSPLTISVVWAYRIVIVNNISSFSNPLEFLENIVNLTNYYFVLLILSPILIILSLVLICLIEMRLGNRRYGLRQLV